MLLGMGAKKQDTHVTIAKDRGAHELEVVGRRGSGSGGMCCRKSGDPGNA